MRERRTRHHAWLTTRRERRATNRLATVTAALLLAACGGGGGKKADTYARATDAQQDCCENLTGPARDQCLGEVVRVEDQGVAKTDTNQATYACVIEHFTCDPKTGHPTQPSAQAQLECIQDLKEQ